MGELRRFVRAEPACFVLVAAVYLVYFWSDGYDRFYFDSQGYWDLGELYGREAVFSLFAFDDVKRGYSYPLVDFVLQTIADAVDVSDVAIVRMSGALLAATFGVVVAPRLARALFPGAVTTWWRVLALNGIVFLLWRDHFQFPLTDFPTLLIASVGVIGLLRRATRGYLVAGLCFGLAANMRFAYVIVALIALLAVLLLPRAAGWKSRTAATTIVLVPMFVVSLPQVALNLHHRDSWSPITPSPRAHTLEYLTLGLQAQRHETFVGSPDVYPSPLVFYLDPTTRGAIDDETLPLESREQYARIVLESPLALTASYALHVFNGLDVRHVTPYVRDLGDKPLVLPIVQFTLLFIAATQLALPDARRRLGGVRWLGVAVLLGSLLFILPASMTPRYFLAVHLLAYLLVCFSPGLRKTFLQGRLARSISLGLLYAVVLATCLLLSEATQNQIEHEPREAVWGAEYV